MAEQVRIAPVLLLAFVLAACEGGGEGKSSNVVSKAAAKTRYATGEKVSVEIAVTGAGVRDPFHVTGRGVMDSTSAEVWFKDDRRSSGFSMHQLFLTEHGHAVIYQTSPPLTKGLPRGKKWMRFDLQAGLAKKYGMNLSGIAGVYENPSWLLDFLRGRDLEPKAVGDATIGGVPVTHYRVDVGLVEAVKAIGASQAMTRGLRRKVGTRTVPVDVWVDRKGYVRREQVVFSLTAPRGRTRTSTATAFSAFGTGVEVEAPPRDEVVDETSLLNETG